MTPQSGLRSLFIPLKDFLFPPVCFACDRHLPDSRQSVCESCWAGIRRVVPDDPVFLETRAKLLSGGHVDELAAAFIFEKEGALQSLIHQLKYEEMTILGVELGKKLGEIIASTMTGTEILIPVPLHPIKLRERGYNQSEFVCEGIRSVLRIEQESNLLCRHRYTRSQTTLSVEERKANVLDAFSISKKRSSAASGRTYMLVDDVITTGSTIKECARVLHASGARRVTACVVALAP